MRRGEKREKNRVRKKLHEVYFILLYKNINNILSYEYTGFINFYAHTHTTFLITSYEAYLSSPPL